MQLKTGRCLCGSVKYKIESDSITATVCHCEDCQRHSGTAFAVLLIVPAGSVNFERSDSLTQYVSKGGSGAATTRFFCSKCGSSIMSLADAAKQVEIVKAGTLDDKSGIDPVSHYWCEKAQPWVEINKKTTKFQRDS